MVTLMYCLLGLAAVGGLCWFSARIAARQQRLTADLTRLERLAAEVTMHAEAILERVDDRTDRLNQLAATVESRVKEMTAAVAVAAAPAPAPVAEVQEAPVPKKRGRGKKQAEPAVAETPVVETPVTEPGTTSILRYQALRSDVWQLADQGMDAKEIAQRLNIPRGEVQLLLNLRSRKVTA